MDDRTKGAVIDRVIECLETAGRTIDTGTYEQLFRGISEVLEDVEGCADQYSALKRLTYAQRNYGHADELEGFDIGACWGSMKVMEAVERRHEDIEDRQRCRSIVCNHSNMFKFIEKNPGITQGELASLLETTPSSLSQTLSRILPFRLIAVTVNGRTKHYRLTPYAERLVVELDLKESYQIDENGATGFVIDEMPTSGDLFEWHGKAQNLEDNNSFPKKPCHSFMSTGGGRKDLTRTPGIHTDNTLSSNNSNQQLPLSA